MSRQHSTIGTRRGAMSTKPGSDGDTSLEKVAEVQKRLLENDEPYFVELKDPRWIRTCQECGHEDIYPQPSTDGSMTDAYRARKCKRCKSEALDYGSFKENPRS